jgi:hypothetical protein
MLEIVRVDEPVLVSVTIWTALVVPTFWLPNCKLVAVSEAAGPEATAVPERVTDWGDPDALSGMLSDALRLPVAVGVNVTEMMQFPPDARLVPQLLDCPKSPAFVPVTVMLPIIMDPDPVFVSDTV